MIDLAERIKNEIYIMSPRGEIVARRSPRTIDEKEIKKIIKGFGRSPKGSVLLAEYKSDPIFISLSLCRSSGFLIAVIPYCPTEAVLGYLEISGDKEILISEGLKSVESAKRIAQTELDAVVEALSILRMRSADVGVISKISAAELMRRISLSTENIADQVGCRINVKKPVILEEITNFDICFFEAFMLCFSMLVRRASPCRNAELGFFMTKSGLAVRVETELLSGYAPDELVDIKSFAESNEMYFAIFENKSAICVELCPHRPDVSRIGLKNNDIFLT